ncbi:MAG: hypothetical protein KGI51_14955, partial [Rhodospirillales bacterium]|nr:hypothetical protein [Rhodospirillales bacterium]
LAAAALAERGGDWPAAEAALARAVGRAVPASGVLDPGQQRLLLRLAAARVRVGDLAGLAALRAQAGRMAPGPMADMFRLLTAPPGPGGAAPEGAETMAALAARFGAALKSVR